jgi:hypothetical protein
MYFSKSVAVEDLGRWFERMFVADANGRGSINVFIENILKS